MKQRRARQRLDDSDDEPESGSAEMKHKTLEEIREEQRQRRARGGVQAASTFDRPEENKPKNRAGMGAEQEDEDDEDGPKQKSIGEMMDANFTGIRYMRKEDDIKHKTLMEEYIKEKLGKKEQELDDENGEGMKKRPGKVEKLQQIADEINARGEGVKQEKDPLNEGVGQGAPIAYSTGIAEVSLPIEFKMKNIHETERARRLLEDKQSRGGRGRDDEPVGNMTTNYHKFRREYAVEMRQKDRSNGVAAPRAFRRDDGQGPSGREAMSDDQVYERFKKRARR